ncbi:AAA family ATPase [Halostagnicola sp. A-GB9-2]|uniref:Cdc6/Cdc18 family protein n=1 Tax=Halostagnicola sp. A-GB9-2 TaxID=3048066 RepID=UPI0024BF5244|nr:AAA family ATPase [Halostagnicola sp. A-GB9-2]MDJ1433970.1 AAA family ATPase [Halostagnicola sp. A-GB9-2]
MGEEAADALIYGSSGVGKTASSAYLLRQLNQSRSIGSATIECAGKTGYGVIYEALDCHRTTTAIQPNAPTRKLIRTLRKIVDEPYVLVLDEADTLPNLELLEELLQIRGISVLAITHDNDGWLSRLPGDLAERFRGDGEVHFGKYNDSELVDILEPRAKRGLEVGSVRSGQLEWIAAEAEGEARFAIMSLLSAAELAEERGHDRIGESDIDDSFARAKRNVRESNLRSLPPVYKVTYELVRGYGPGGVKSTELKEVYFEQREEIFGQLDRDPVGWRSIRGYLSKLDDYGLIDSKGNTSDLRFWATDPEIKPWIDIEMGTVTA